jgi:hypothetical protein
MAASHRGSMALCRRRIIWTVPYNAIDQRKRHLEVRLGPRLFLLMVELKRAILAPGRISSRARLVSRAWNGRAKQWQGSPREPSFVHFCILQDLDLFLLGPRRFVANGSEHHRTRSVWRFECKSVSLSEVCSWGLRLYCRPLELSRFIS